MPVLVLRQLLTTLLSRRYTTILMAYGLRKMLTQASRLYHHLQNQPSSSTLSAVLLMGFPSTLLMFVTMHRCLLGALSAAHHPQNLAAPGCRVCFFDTPHSAHVGLAASKTHVCGQQTLQQLKHGLDACVKSLQSSASRLTISSTWTRQDSALVKRLASVCLSLQEIWLAVSRLSPVLVKVPQ